MAGGSILGQVVDFRAGPILGQVCRFYRALFGVPSLEPSWDFIPNSLCVDSVRSDNFSLTPTRA
jgi:hypothetical protein